jgi:hypothetical protein
VRDSATIDDPEGAAAWTRRAPETRLLPHDFDRALRRMKTDLALMDLRRRLLDPHLDARAVLEITARIQALQAER